MTQQRVFEPALVTADRVEAAQLKAEELFSALVTAKNEWQYAIKGEDEKYLRVLELKAEYTEWRALALRLAEMFAGKRDSQPTVIEPAARGAGGFAMSHAVPGKRTANA